MTIGEHDVNVLSVDTIERAECVSGIHDEAYVRSLGGHKSRHLFDGHHKRLIAWHMVDEDAAQPARKSVGREGRRQLGHSLGAQIGRVDDGKVDGHFNEPSVTAGALFFEALLVGAVRGAEYEDLIGGGELQAAQHAGECERAVVDQSELVGRTGEHAFGV